MFAIDDPWAIGADLATRQRHGQEMASAIITSPGQAPAFLGSLPVDLAPKITQGNLRPRQPSMILPKMLTRENVATDKGWSAK